MRNTHAVLFIPIASLAFAPPALNTAVGDSDISINESFEESFGLWTAHGHRFQPGWEECPEPQGDLPPLGWCVTRTDEIALDGDWSLSLWANGFGDEGTVWVQRPVALPAGEWTIDIEFHIWSMSQSDLNAWQAVAFADTFEPETIFDFTIVGDLDLVAGWHPYTHHRELTLEEAATVWIAVGYDISWETVREHFLDAIAISISGDGCLGDLNGDGVIDGADLAAMLASWGACAGCPADLNADGDVNGADLATLLSSWGECE